MSVNDTNRPAPPADAMADPKAPDEKPESPLTEDADYFPEDERSAMDEESEDGEGDDSMSADDLNAELDAKLGKAPDIPRADTRSAPGPAPENAPSLPHEQYFPEDERSSMDWEDDHSITVEDADDSDLGRPAKKISKVTAPDTGGDTMHPDLAASLNASLAYARNGLSPDGDQDIPAGEAASPADDGSAANDGSAAMPAVAKNAQNTRPVVISSSAAGKTALPPSAGEGGGADKKDTGNNDEEDEDEEEEDEGGLGRPMSLRDHLHELRKRITRAFLWAVAGFAVCYPFAERLFTLLLAPLANVLPSGGHFIFTSPPEAFIVHMKVAFVAGIFITSPLVFYQIWAFIAPGLYKEEKVYILPIAFFSALLFICGGAFCYGVAFPYAFEFFMSYNTEAIKAMPGLDETFSFVLQLLLAFGLIFELPLFVFFLARLGIVTADMMRRFRRYAILANVILAAILTPPDVTSQLLMAGPLLALYELGIIIAAVFGKKKAKPAEDEEEDEEDVDEEEDEEDTDDEKGETKEGSTPVAGVGAR